MGEDPAASESDASHEVAGRRGRAGLVGALLLLALAATARADALDEVRARGTLRYGSDMEGGAPYAFPDPDSPRSVAGFEVDIMDRLARALGEGVRAEFSQGPWDRLLGVLDSGRVDVVVNGYEWTPERAEDYLATRPYYIYQLQLMGPKGTPAGSWDDLGRPKPDGSPWTVAVLTASAADDFAHDSDAGAVRVVRFDGATDAMLAVQNGQCDFTLQDGPAAAHYAGAFPGLRAVGPPVSRGYYVIYARRSDHALRDALDAAIGRLAASGELRRILEKHGVWNDLQAGLATDFQGPIEVPTTRRAARGWGLVPHYGDRLRAAALVTLGLSFGSMPLAMAIGLMVAIGRMYGPAPLRLALAAYVELIRGTPLMLQLYVLFFVLKLDPWVAGIAGLAINYSAYEAEIYRAGLQAVPRGQMEAALALGMSRGQALRRVVVPQAARIVIPPVSNDFIALFKDTSVCSVITLVELTKEYSILANGTRAVVEFATATAAIYLAMSLPLSWFARWAERRLGAEGTKGGLA
ncbi:ABC transporter permease subunit [Paludisphaera sp.]|uniref:ABC transporter permease subunit n=1 Tax=Paludisphaera sp. TaxID=2017432 RepID=UPI00301BC679